MKIVFLTYHNWQTKREGGFHKFAEAFANSGHETIFFSFARPYYIYLKKDERLNKKVLKNLSKGLKCFTKEGNEILNITWPTLNLPNPLSKLFSSTIINFFKTRSITPFKNFHFKFLKNTDVYVFESAEGLLLYKRIKQLDPTAKFVYRPSDPKLLDNVSKHIKSCEIEIITNSDLNILVNKNAYKLFSKIPGFNKQKTKIIQNGIDLNRFSNSYEKPELLQKINSTALYVGARRPNWDLIIETAKTLLHINFIIICPDLPKKNITRSIKDLNNLFFIPGISPEKVPHWITNSDLIMIPYIENEYLNVPRGITAKYYQAIIAKKPVVVYHDTKELEKFGISVNYDRTSFIDAIKEVFQSNFSVSYDKISVNDWKDIQEEFLLNIKTLVSD